METPEGLQGIITLLSLPIFFASNALYPINAFPEILQVVAMVNPLSHLINGIRFFAIGSDFSAIGIHYVYTPMSIVVSFLVLVVFATAMYLASWWRFKKAVVT